MIKTGKRAAFLGLLALLSLFLPVSFSASEETDPVPGVEQETETPRQESDDPDDSQDVPDDVRDLKAVIVNETTVALSWPKVSRVTGYQVVLTDTTTGKKKKTEIGERKLKVENLTPGVRYEFQVRAVRNGVTSRNFSPKAVVRTAVNKPEQVKQVRMAKYVDKGIFFRWNKADQATSYEIYYKKKEASSYRLAGTTEGLSYTLTGLKANTWYSVRVRAVRTVSGVERKGKISAAMSAMAEKIILPNIHGRRFNVTAKQTCTAKEYGTNKPIVIKAGTRMLAWQGGGRVVTCDLTSDPNQKTNYKVIQIEIRYLKYSHLAVTSNWYVYTRQQKELWLNQRNYTSSTNYLIWVNQYTCNMSVFQKSGGRWKMVRSSVCVVGKYGGTGVGTAKLLYRVPYLYGDVAVYFTWNAQKQQGNAFHKRLDGNSRAAVSHGCVRLGYSDLHYVYGLPMGTTVVLT